MERHVQTGARNNARFSAGFGHQSAFGVLNRLRSNAGQGKAVLRICAKIVLRALGPVASHIVRSRSFVTASIYGHPLIMRIDHRLPEILASVPSFNQPLGFLAEALAANGRTISVIDVGANIGDTVALIEHSCPGQAHYLCIEPDPEFSSLCALNLHGNPRARLLTEFIGDREEAEVTLVQHLPGTAASRIVAHEDRTNGNIRNVVRLDSVARTFAAEHGLHLIKCDTDGFDFPVLRSAAALLDAHHPALHFEWHPDLWIKAGEDPIAIFDYLSGRGYTNLVFFTNRGDFFCTTGIRDPRLFEGLRDLCLARQAIDDLHFDVIAAGDPLCSRVIEKSLARFRRPTQ